jgi:hypothetical protein
VQIKSNIKFNIQCSWQCSQRRRTLVDIKSFPMSSATPPCLVQPICSQPRAFGSLHFVWCLVVFGIVIHRLVVEIKSRATAPGLVPTSLGLCLFTWSGSILACVCECVIVVLIEMKLDTLGIEPRASHMLSGCDTTTPRAPLA